MRFINTIAICLSLFFNGYCTEKNVYPEICYSNFCHQISAIDVVGNRLELEDGSVWSVSQSDSNKIFLWSSLDPLVIYPNKNIFYNYHYRIENLATNTSVLVDLNIEPVIEAEHSLQIESIDHWSGKVILSDNSHWKFNSIDLNTYNNWCIGDLIIIGMNECSFLSSEKFILINAKRVNYSRVNPL